MTIFTRSASQTTDELGNEIPAEAAVQTVGEIQQRRRTEDEDQGEVSESDWLGVFLPADAVHLNTASGIWAQGLGMFEVVGAPWPARNPRTQTESHVELTLRRTAGADDEVGS